MVVADFKRNAFFFEIVAVLRFREFGSVLRPVCSIRVALHALSAFHFSVYGRIMNAEGEGYLFNGQFRFEHSF